MTQISPKSNTQNKTNSKGSISNPIPVENQTPGSNTPLSDQSGAFSEPKAIKLPEIERMSGKAQTQKNPLQRQSASWWQSQSLRTKATALAVAIGTIPVLLTGFTAYQFANQSITKQFSATKISRATGMEDKVLRFIRFRYSDIQVISNLPVLSDPKLIETIPLSKKQETLDKFVEFYQVYDSIAVFDLKGNAIVQSEGSPITENYSDRDYFQAVIKTNQPFISKPENSKYTGKPVIFFAAPIKDKSTGKTIAVVRSSMPVKALDELIANFGEGGDEYHLIDFSDGGKMFVANNNNKDNKEALAAFSDFKKLQATGKENSLIATDEIDKSQKLLAYTPFGKLEGLPELKWGALIATPLDIAFAPQRQLLLAIAIGTAVTALLVAALSAYIANRGTRPIVAAASAVDKIGQGELDTRLEVEGGDELAALSANINEMAEQLGNFVAEQALATSQARLLAEITTVRSVGIQALQDIFDVAVVGGKRIFNADRVIIYRLNPDGSGDVAAESVNSGRPHALNGNIKHPPLSQQLLSAHSDRGIVAINDISAADLSVEHLKFMERLDVKASIDVLILERGQPFGLLSVHRCGNSPDWQPNEIDFLKRLAEQMQLSLDRVNLLEQTRNLAEEQRNLKEGLQKRALELLMEVDPISKGDLSIRAKVTADEIGTIADSYNATVGNLRKIVLQVQKAANQVAQTTSSNEASIQSLSAEALRQAEEISTALHQVQDMSQSVQLVANNAQQAEAAVREATQMIQEGDSAMNRTVDGIIAIRETVAETAKKVKHLGESSQKISTVVNLIGTFAAQTNLLALNASIEAARAGEEGRGFAVVADEVRSLARQSAEATSEIEKLVAAIQAETNEVVAAMEAGTQQVVMGTQLVDETRQSLNKITAVSNQINKLVEEIAMATIIQAQASEAVTKTMSNVAEITTQTSKEAGLVSSSFEQLRKVAQVLQDEVGQFKVS
ncbi:methyl-accepting chemotaxis protein [Limnofasciculus baicalensis]|uniref:Methyl-accepting chemotaxis protein n=1 Tax=Limnofasciculus baicalensis BBK-W-15 TaxID=2699891 RepID=A0AAE3KLI0_9CYAN|nr:methyl-accepting chemotaxis protein [Limnofasciculus baicalensis]MCP2728099.1 methyl-accepting chemotaxis protein [Limnofasciculus baicalensis BBK-W-15]